MGIPTLPTPRRHRDRSAGQAVAWILAIVATIAVVVLIVLLVRSGQQVDTAQQQQQEQITQLQDQLSRAEARARLNALKSSINAGVEEESLQTQYDSVRTDLENSFSEASGEAQNVWESIREDLDALGDQIGESSEEAVATIDRMLEQLRGGA